MVRFNLCTFFKIYFQTLKDSLKNDPSRIYIFIKVHWLQFLLGFNMGFKMVFTFENDLIELNADHFGFMFMCLL